MFRLLRAPARQRIVRSLLAILVWYAVSPAVLAWQVHRDPVGWQRICTAWGVAAPRAGESRRVPASHGHGAFCALCLAAPHAAPPPIDLAVAFIPQESESPVAGTPAWRAAHPPQLPPARGPPPHRRHA